MYSGGTKQEMRERIRYAALADAQKSGAGDVTSPQKVPRGAGRHRELLMTQPA
jgi:hypothetical protein